MFSKLTDCFAHPYLSAAPPRSSLCSMLAGIDYSRTVIQPPRRSAAVWRSRPNGVPGRWVVPTTYDHSNWS